MPYRLLFRNFSRLMEKRGYRLVDSNTFDWPVRDEEFKEVFAKQLKFNGWTDDGPKVQRIYMIRNFLFMVKAIPGNWAECGVFKGSTALIMAEYAKQHHLISGDHKIHLFDSFCGLSAPDKQDGKTFFKEGDYACSLEEVKGNLKNYALFDFHKGWIPECFKGCENLSFSFVHIDVDLYQPVKDSLAFFIPKMQKGGIIVLDDYGHTQTTGARKATDEMAETFNLPVGRLPFGQAFMIKN